MVVSEVKQAVWGLSVTAGQGAARLGKQLAVFLIALLVHVSAFGQQNTQTFTFQGNTFQDYTAPATGWYFLDARGAQGGPASNYSHQGGWGARMQGYIHLQAGDTLTIAVGGAGQVGQNIGNKVSGGGGGGGSSVLKGASPLLFAGGGGGAGAAADGLPGLNTVNGGSAAGAGGTGGSGGGIGASKYGGAGGGGYDGGGGTHLDGSSPPILSQGGSAY
ncbi:MAG TPA: hypothetical protein VLA15_05520, partial [Desulfurivibrionaceae bacterium]|nr:hypothetical protein [Desulfurivibrionaceae bacterium]